MNSEDPEGFRRNGEIDKVIDNLRSEVATQKECITRYTIHSMAFVSVVWGLVFKLNGFGLPFYFCDAVLVFMLIAVARIANHKYATINRNLGYELHFSRIKDYIQIGSKELANAMLSTGWEEAMCAWRFVQPTLYEKVYEVPKHRYFKIFFRDRLKPDQRSPNLYYWYDTYELIAPGAIYHQGRYLRNIHLFLHSLSAFSIAVMWCFLGYQIASFAFHAITGQVAVNWVFVTFKAIQFAGIALVASIITFVLITQMLRQIRYRKILEGEFLSIQSCAVVWRIVVTCHLLGSAWALKQHKGYRYYTTYTSALAVKFAENNFNQPNIWLSEWEGCYGSEVMYEKLKELLADVPLPPYRERRRNQT